VYPTRQARLAADRPEVHRVHADRAVRARRAPELAVPRPAVADPARRHARCMCIAGIAIAVVLRRAPRRRHRVRLARLARRAPARLRRKRVVRTQRARRAARLRLERPRQARRTHTAVRAGVTSITSTSSTDRARDRRIRVHRTRQASRRSARTDRHRVRPRAAVRARGAPGTRLVLPGKAQLARTGQPRAPGRTVKFARGQRRASGR
jgi:hypothetical protein